MGKREGDVDLLSCISEGEGAYIVEFVYHPFKRNKIHSDHYGTKIQIEMNLESP